MRSLISPRAVALAALLLAAPSLGGCVRRDVYEEAVAALHQARNDAAQQRAQVTTLQGRVAQLEAEVARLEGDRKALDARLADLGTQTSNQSKRIDDLVALNDELSRRLKAAGKSVEELSSERGSMDKALADMRARLEELRRQQAAAEARAAAFRDLQAKLQKLIEAGRLKVVVRGERMLLELANDVLFDSGKTDLKPEGKKTLVEVAGVLKGLRDRKFQVAGHTDNVQIRGGKFASNWELSTARALEVTTLLIQSGMDPKNLSAAGYGEWTPVASNDTPEGRAKNRRIEIALVPNLEEFVKLTESATPAKGKP